jgi:transposase InsO family protein
VSAPWRLACGQRIWFEDEQHLVEGLLDNAVRLRSQTGRVQIILLGALLGDATFRHTDQQEVQALDGVGVSPDGTALLNSIDEAQRARVLDLQAHLLELTTGYGSGDAASAVEGEPRAEYQPGRPMAQRVAAKASELDCGVRVVWKHLRRWREQGLWGLVDGRTVRLIQPLAGVDGRIIDAILAQHTVTEADDSTGSLLRLRRRVQARLDSLHGDGVVRLPSQSTFARYVAHLLPGRYTTGPATTRQSAANRPDKVYGVISASRPGEVVMLDTSWLDALAYDPEQDIPFSVELTIAIDICTRSLLAWRMNPKGTKAVDAGLLIGDAMTPEPMRPGWPDSLRHAMLRLPVQRVLSADERFAAAAARPVIYPETIVIDHGKAFASEAVKDVCRRYGITIQDARVFRPTDKPQVEAAFRVIRSQLAEHLAGYKGYHVAHRGRDPESVARWTLSELEEYFAEYVVAVYQRRSHDGLVVAGFPEINLSPNDAYRLAIARAGYVACPSDPNLFLQLLPIEWRKIHHYGVDYDCLTYNGKGIRRYRNVDSPYRGRHAGKWPIRVDPRDMSQVFFHDPYSGAWHRLRWNHALTGTEPFTDVTLREVKQILAERGRNPRDERQIAEALWQLQNRTDATEAATAKTRRARIRDAERARAAARDRARTRLPADSAPPNPASPSRTPALRLVPDPPDGEFDIDFDAITGYESWGGEPAGQDQR